MVIDRLGSWLLSVSRRRGLCKCAWQDASPCTDLLHKGSACGQTMSLTLISCQEGVSAKPGACVCVWYGTTPNGKQVFPVSLHLAMMDVL